MKGVIMKKSRNWLQLVAMGAMAVVLAFGMVACGDLDPDPENMNGDLVITGGGYDGEELTASYSGTEKNVNFQWNLNGVDTATTKTYTPNVIGKVTVTVSSGDKEPKSVSLAIGPVDLKDTYWTASGVTGGATSVAFDETLEITNELFKLDNDIVKATPSGFEYFYFDIEEWEEVKVADIPNDSKTVGFKSSGYKITGTSRESGYETVSSCRLFFNSGKTEFVWERGTKILERNPNFTKGIKPTT
jgi:hypothetical protein